MKKLCFLLSIVIHALLLLLAPGARFQVTIQPEPPRVVTVTITDPPLPYYGLQGVPGGEPAPTGAWPDATNGAAAGSAKGGARGALSGAVVSKGVLPFPAAEKLSLNSSPAGSFRLAPVGKSPEPWAVPVGPAGPPRPLQYRVNAYRPGTAPSGDGGSGGVFLLPFDIREKEVAGWANAVLVRIERNWSIPASGRLAFSGRVQISLTIERQGHQRALVIDDSNVPEPLTLAALHAVQASLPLPPLPEKVAGESFAFTFVFAYNG